MNRVQKSKLQYILIISVLSLLSVSIVSTFFKDKIEQGLIFIMILFFIPGRIQGHFHREFYRGRKLLSQRKFKESINHFRRFLEELKEQPWKKRLIWLVWGGYSKDIMAMTLNNLGIAYMYLGEFKEAKKQLELALKQDSLYPIPYYNLALITMAEQHNKDAEKYFHKAKDLGYHGSTFDQLLHKAQDLLAYIEGR